MSFRRFTSAGLSLIGMAVVLASGAATGEQARAKRPVVVELYTSQGCSSCPPADAILGQLAGRKDLLAVSLPVTYWDMLGWRDTLASDGNTQRQKAYAKQLGHGGVYTPEIIVDGVTDVIGSREQTVQAAIAARESDMQAVPVQLAGNAQQVQIAIGAAPERTATREATIWLLGLLPQASVSIGEGENRGHTITYRNVVRQIRALGTWKGQSLSMSVPRSQAGAPRNSIAVVVQQGGYGRVIGAALLDRPNF
jgi:hypothetical protein